MIKVWAILATSTLLVSCADNFPAASAADLERSEMRAARCMSQKVRELDDQLSNARTVGESVVQSCRPELQQLLYTSTQGQGPAYRRGYEDGFWPDMIGQATAEVLKRRAAAR